MTWRRSMSEMLVEDALDSVRPYIEPHGGEVECLTWAAAMSTRGPAALATGCAGSKMTLTRGIGTAIMIGGSRVVEMLAGEPLPLLC